MEQDKHDWDFYKRLVTMLAQQFGHDCEVVLHDLTGDYNHTIIAIENGHITGRTIGDCGSNFGLEVLRGTVVNGDRYNYVTHHTNGKILKSSTTYIKDREGNVIGSLCINSDLTDYMKLSEKLQKFIGLPKEGVSAEEDKEEIFAGNVRDLLEEILEGLVRSGGKTPEEMNREEKKQFIALLDKKGAFLISKSAERVCEFLKISKYTLYNYLEKVRNNGQK